MAEALATVTPALTRAASACPSATQLRTALYQHAFNPAHAATADPATCVQVPDLRFCAISAQSHTSSAVGGTIRKLPHTNEIGIEQSNFTLLIGYMSV